MKKIGILIFLMSIGFLANAQYVLPDSSKRFKAPEKVKFSLQTGTSFFTSPGMFSGTSLYVAPTMSYQLTPRFRLNAGVMLMQQRFSLSSSQLFPSQEQSVVIKNTPSVQGIVYAQGDYFLSDKLTLSGSVMKSINTNKNTDIWRNNFQSMSLDLNYKLSPTISVGAGVRMIQNNGFPGYYNYSSGSSFYNPLMGY